MTNPDLKPKSKKRKDTKEEDKEEEPVSPLLGLPQLVEKDIKQKVYNQVYDTFLKEY